MLKQGQKKMMISSGVNAVGRRYVSTVQRLRPEHHRVATKRAPKRMQRGRTHAVDATCWLTQWLALFCGGLFERQRVDRNSIYPEKKNKNLQFYFNEEKERRNTKPTTRPKEER